MNEEKFSGKATVYTKYRPTYPEELINYLYSEVGVSKNSIIADIGSGTGILSKQLLMKSSSVICIEPNIDMLDIAKQELKDFPNCSFIKTTAEHTTLDENSTDFITVGQAFHWFDQDKFKLECKRILKNRGKVILIWYCVDMENECAIENEKINRKYCPDFKGFEWTFKKTPEAYAEFFKNGVCDFKIYKDNQIFNEENFVGMNLSASFAPMKNSEDYYEYINELKKMFNKYKKDGFIMIPKVTISFVGEV